MTALGPSRLDRPSHGLWGLWEMLELRAASFYNATTHLSALASYISGADEGDIFHKDRRTEARRTV